MGAGLADRRQDERLQRPGRRLVDDVSAKVTSTASSDGGARGSSWARGKSAAGPYCIEDRGGFRPGPSLGTERGYLCAAHSAINDPATAARSAIT